MEINFEQQKQAHPIMRFINTSRFSKITGTINRLFNSRLFGIGVVSAVATLTVSVALAQYLIMVRIRPATPLSPLGKILETQALGVASESAQATPTVALTTANIVSDTKPKVTPKVENKGIGQTQPPSPAQPPAEKPVTIRSNKGRINFPNNKFGVYSVNIGGDMERAAELVNSNGGDWGWVLIPMSIHENSVDGWNSTFGKLAEKHLIPVIQLIEPDAQHKIPSESDIDAVASFLASLSWPTKIKAVSAFNEMNASEYWGGKIDPEGYARVLNRLADQLHGKSGEFFVMNGAFNASAQTGDATGVNCIKTDLGVNSCYLSEIGFIQRMVAAVPDVLKKLDGWATHTYPHPGYVGPPRSRQWGAEADIEVGRNSIVSYKFEQRLLAKYGVSLPIFITETGWPHREGDVEHKEWLPADTVASYYKQVFSNYFLPDSSVVAVMPFLLSGGGNPFKNFSFIGTDGTKFPQWDVIAGFAKTAGNPPR